VGQPGACEFFLAEPRLTNFELPSLSTQRLGEPHALRAPPAARLSVRLKAMGSQSFSALNGSARKNSHAPFDAQYLGDAFLIVFRSISCFPRHFLIRQLLPPGVFRRRTGFIPQSHLRQRSFEMESLSALRIGVPQAVLVNAWGAPSR